MVRYRLNSPDVIHETVDHEALVIHTPSGAYFSLQGTAEYVWNALLSGYSTAEIASAYADSTEVDSAQTHAAIDQYVKELVDHALILPTDQQVELQTLPPAPHSFSAPTVQKFTDMQELLLVDPIHEVDPQAGWPQRREA